jgi:hypothetical protein
LALCNSVASVVKAFRRSPETPPPLNFIIDCIADDQKNLRSRTLRK